ncbi:MAG TPA: sigma-70 family RNA polymerase sigma factor [Chthonomonadaceae bacterium]|nr:sigma-70 family RNA polymerase sigma factor [Chthonomonadaceae bacterium]
MCRNTLSLSDNEILDRVQQGERDAYAALFQRYYPRVEGYARRHLHNVEAARDVASETFLRAFRNVDRFRAGERITYFGYLLMICHRLILSEQARYASALARQRMLGTADTLLEQSALPLERVLDQEKETALRAALDRLPTDDRQIIQLAFEQGLSRKEIACVMRKPSVSAVTSHLYRAVRKMKTVLVEQGYFSSLMAGGQAGA